MSSLRSLTAMGVVILVLATAGCAAVLVGGAAVGTYKYVKGELKTTEKVSLDRAWDATIQTMQNLGFNIVEQKKDGLKGKIIAKEANGDNIQVELEKQPNDLTEIRIRVGAFGDEKRSRVILDEIKKRF